MAKTTIYIKGIAMFYHKGDGLWKVLFPFDECHTVKLITPNNDGGESLGVGEGARRVRIKAVKPVSKFDIDPSFDAFLDMTSANAHKDGVKLKDEAKRFVLLSIESAKVSVGETTKCRFQLFYGNQGLAAFKYIAYSGKAEIESERIEIVVDGEVIDSFDQNIMLIFDNRCLTEDANNPISDLILLYDVIEDSGGNGKKFTMDRHPEEKPGARAITKQMFDVLGPRDNNVAPFAPGLPCNVVKADRSNDLE